MWSKSGYAISEYIPVILSKNFFKIIHNIYGCNTYVFWSSSQFFLLEAQYWTDFRQISIDYCSYEFVLLEYQFLKARVLKLAFLVVLQNSQMRYYVLFRFNLQNSNVEDDVQEGDIKQDENWYSSDEEQEPESSAESISPLATLLRTIKTSTSNALETENKSSITSTQVESFVTPLPPASTSTQENESISVCLLHFLIIFLMLVMYISGNKIVSFYRLQLFY